MSQRVSLSKILLTWPKCNATKEIALESLKRSLDDNLECYIIAQERHADNTEHLHATIKLHTAKRVRWNKETREQLFDIMGHHADIELLKTIKDLHRAISYCMKEGNYLISGFNVDAIRERVDANSHKRQYTCKELLTTRIQDLVETDKINAREFMSIYKAQQMWRLINAPNEDLPDVRGRWFWGAPGTGKSYTARRIGEDYGGYFVKPQSKWFDGYQGEPVIILDDLDIAALGHLLKIWGDRYAFTGETKGGTIPVPCKLFIVTSNYSIRQLIERESHNNYIDEPLIAALERRFSQTQFTVVYPTVAWERRMMSYEDALSLPYEAMAPLKNAPTIAEGSLDLFGIAGYK